MFTGQVLCTIWPCLS